MYKLLLLSGKDYIKFGNVNFVGYCIMIKFNSIRNPVIVSKTYNMGAQGISVGILISTYNWPQALERIFQSILNQTHLPDEILIADDGSTDETRQVIHRYRSVYGVPIKHAWHEDNGFRKS